MRRLVYQDIIAHLTSFEQVLKEVLTGIVESETYTSTPSAATPYLTRFTETGSQFNDTEVEARKGKTAREHCGQIGLFRDR